MDSALGHRQWTTFNSSDIGDDPLRVHNAAPKQPTALLDPVELNELHPFDSQNDIVQISAEVAAPKIVENGAKISVKKVGNGVEGAAGKSGGADRPKRGRAEGGERGEVLLTVAPTTSAAATASAERGGGGRDAGTAQIKNGEVLATIQPKCSDPFAWLRRPTYDVSVMPSVLTNKQNKLTADVYTNLMRTLEKDVRFASYALLYSRMIPVWLVFSIVILLAVLASSPMGGLPVMFFGFVWLFMLLFGLLFCAYLQKYIVLALRSLVKELNAISQTFHLLIGIQDRGIIFIFYDFDGCREEVSRQVRVQMANFPPSAANSDIEIAHKSEELMLEHAQAYAKALVKHRLRFPTRPSEGVSDFLPRHVAKNHCLCQFVSMEHFAKGPGKLSAPWYERIFTV